MGIREDIDDLLQECELNLDVVVSLWPRAWERSTVRWILSPLYGAVDYFRGLNDHGGLPDNLRAQGRVFAGIASQLQLLRSEMTESGSLKAVGNSDTWFDPKASQTYNEAFKDAIEKLNKAEIWTSALAVGLSEEATVSDIYYVELLVAVLALAASLAGLVTAETGIGTLIAIVGAVLSRIGVAVVENVRPYEFAEYQICNERWPRPAFG